jgi:hypothetical protein
MGVLVSYTSFGPTWAAIPGTWAAQTGSWLDQNRAYLDDLAVVTPGTTDRTVLVFRGRITDMEARWMGTLAGGTTEVAITAKDFTADLANNRVGDQPWLVEDLGGRVDRILALAAATTTPDQAVTAQIDGTISGTQVTWRDVDSQPAADLVKELASSVASVAWPAVHDPGGAYYWIEDPRNRGALYVLAMGGGGQVVIIANPQVAGAIALTSQNVLEDPIRWTQDVADVATRADITWLAQGTDDKGQPTTTETHHVIVDSALEARLGQRGFSLSTQLISDADATWVASTLLARQHSLSWRLSGVTWSIRYEDTLTVDETHAALALLDGTQRIGHPLTITDLPDWVPVGEVVGVYIEGGSYEFTDGDWVLDLTASSVGIGLSVSWSTVDPTWPWTAFQTLSWIDVSGVGPPTN